MASRKKKVAPVAQEAPATDDTVTQRENVQPEATEPAEAPAAEAVEQAPPSSGLRSRADDLLHLQQRGPGA